MIDSQVFSVGLTLLCTHYDRQLQPEVVRIWKEYLDSQLTTEQFQQAIRITILESRFFPTAKELIEAVKGSGEVQPLEEWDACLKASARADNSMVANLSEQGKFALQSIGGLYKLGQTLEDELRWVKKEFVAAWKAWRPLASPALPPGSTQSRRQIS